MFEGDADEMFGASEVTDSEHRADGGPTMVAKIVPMTYCGGGRGVVAEADLSPGQLVVLEWPVMEWNEEDLSDLIGLAQVADRILLDPRAHDVSRTLHPQELSLLPARDARFFDELVQARSPVSPDEFKRVLFVLKHNGFVSGLYHTLCMFNHSCAPNCIKYSPRAGSRGASEIWTTRPVRKGEELLVSYYTPVEASSDVIRTYLEQQHDFQCHCCRCESHLASLSGRSEDYIQLVHSVEQGIQQHHDNTDQADPDALMSAIADIQEVLLADSLINALCAHGNHHLLCLIYSSMVGACAAFFQIADASGAPLDSPRALNVLQCWLNASVHLSCVQCECFGPDHPALATTYTDVANCVDSIKALFQTQREVMTYTAEDLDAWVEQLQLPALESEDPSRRGALGWSARLHQHCKREAARLRDLYHVVKRNPEMAFVKKLSGLTVWGKVKT